MFLLLFGYDGSEEQQPELVTVHSVTGNVKAALRPPLYMWYTLSRLRKRLRAPSVLQKSRHIKIK